MNTAFYKYYDRIFINKDYKKEVDILCDIYEKYSKKKLASILDVGCGTGNHSIEFAMRGINTNAIDIDKNIIMIAKQKLRRENTLPLRFSLKDIATYRVRSKYNMAISIFNVINYIPTLNGLEIFFNGIYKALDNNGLYVFDCINGVAAVIDPPHVKKDDVRFSDGTRIKISITPLYDALMQNAVLEYDISVIEQSKKTLVKHNISQFYWTPVVIKNILENAGFSVLQISKWMQSDIQATENDWKIMYVCIRM